MTKENDSKKEAEDLINLIFSALFSETELDNSENLLDTLFLDQSMLDDVFRKKDEYPTAKDIEEQHSKISNSNPYKDIMNSSIKGIRQHEKTKKDMVDHPDHYNQGPIETMEKFMLINHNNPDKIKGALEFNIIKYTDRVGHKDATPEGVKEDNSKTEFYYDLYNLLFPESTRFIDLYRVWKESKK